MYESRNSVEQFLVVQGAGAAWAMRAAHVARFVAPAQWQGPQALTAQWCESASDISSSPRCLLVFRTASGERAIEITGTVTTSELDVQKVRPLPAPCLPRRSAELVVSAIAIDGEDALFLIVEPAVSRGGG